jgi:hypothetical protein
MDFVYTPTTDGFYALSYKDRLVTIDLATGQLILMPVPIPASQVRFDMKYGQNTNGSPYVQIRVTGNFTVSTSVIPVFTVTRTPTTVIFALAARLTNINGVLCIAPVIISQDAVNDATLLPGSYCLVDWTAIGIVSDRIVSYPLTPVCADNTKPDLGSAPSMWTGWIWGIVFVILLIVLFLIAYALRRTEKVHDPRLPVVLSLIHS